MASGIPLDTAAIMSTVLEGILYGFSVLMFMGTIWTLTHKHRVRDVNRPIAAVTVLLLVLSTAHMVVDTIRIIDGLVKYRDTFPGGPAEFFADVAQETFVIKNAIYTLQTLLGDGVVIYRCYVVWRSVLVIILPSMLWCGVAVAGISSVYSVSQATSNAGNIFARATGQWISAFFALTLSTNLISTGLLAYRIWTLERNISKIRATKGTTMHILRVLVDAAILYSVALFSALMCFVRSSNGQYVMLDMLMPIISIAFYMVMIRIAVGKQSYLSTVRGGTTNETGDGSLGQYLMRPLRVHISQLKHNNCALGDEMANQHQLSTCKTESVDKISTHV